ncbi:MAG: DinB family protein, partial [Woeseia sp.]
MASSEAAAQPDDPSISLPERYQQLRSLTVELCRYLEPEDTVVQSMPDVSPTRWHLAHVTWFFEHFVLEAQLPGYKRFDDRCGFLFNSYYYSVGQMHPRPKRGLLTRPTLKEVIEYRAHVDEAVLKLLGSRPNDAEIEQLIVLGLNHEQQHQELLLTDIKHVFSRN